MKNDRGRNIFRKFYQWSQESDHIGFEIGFWVLITNIKNVDEKVNRYID